MNLEHIKKDLSYFDNVTIATFGNDGFSAQISFMCKNGTLASFVFNIADRLQNGYGLKISAVLDDEVKVIRKPVAEISGFVVFKACQEIATSIQRAYFSENYWIAQYQKSLHDALRLKAETKKQEVKK